VDDWKCTPFFPTGGLSWVFGGKGAGAAGCFLLPPLFRTVLEYVSMNPDQQLIESAYQDAVRKLYAAFFDHYVTAAGDAAMIEEADRHFSTGLVLARVSRDRAIALAA